MSLPLIVTDLDGTLLDHHDYSFAAAESALRELKQRGIPVLINSSKTRREITALQEQLGINDPFICENGAAIYIQDQSRREVLFKQLATERQTVLRALHRLRIEYGYNFTGFADAPAAEIAELTGLTLEQAGWASERDYSEPLVWQESSERLPLFQRQLELLGLKAQQGGRFLTVAAPCDKARAMLLLQDWYAEREPVFTVALGDSPNDRKMLEAADIAVVIRSPRTAELELARVGKTIRSRGYGPEGWQEVMAELLDSDSFQVGEE